jgi:hypothetical protein
MAIRVGYTSGPKSSEPWYFWTDYVTHYIYCLWFFLCCWIYLVKIFSTTLIILLSEFQCIFRVILFYLFFSPNPSQNTKYKKGREKITPLIYTACHGSVMYLPGDCWKRTRLCGRIGSCFEPDPLFPMKKIIIQYGRNHLLFIIIIIWNVSMWTLIVFLILSNLNHDQLDHSIMYYR